MYVIVGILVGVIITLICILGSYMRQVKDICRQLRFLREHESNMLITKEIKLGNIKELTDLLNEMIKERKEEAAQYVKKERMIADTYTNLSHDIRTPIVALYAAFRKYAGGICSAGTFEIFCAAYLPDPRKFLF